MTTQAPSAAALLSHPWGNPPKTKEEILQEWIDAQSTLLVAKEKELKCRNLAIAQFPELAAVNEGTVYAPLANGWRLKAVKGFNYNLKNTDGLLNAALDAYEKAAPNAEELGRRKLETEKLVKWKPDLSISEYRAASDELKKAIESNLTITPAAPSLMLIEPKNKP